MKAFLTGSYAYGTPTEDSDVDIVLLVEEEDEETMKMISCSSLLRSKADKTEKYGTNYGNLNLIVCDNEETFEIWREGTEVLKEFKPVTRDVAISIMDLIRMGEKVELARRILRPKLTRA